MSGRKEWQHLKIPFGEIEIATKNFETCIGKGGYGWVCKGELSLSGKLTTVAVKRLNEHLQQGLKEFLTEIQLLSGQKHENLISLVGYCDEGKEKIIVYEYAERGSLDKYIRRTSTNTNTLTWLQRLKVCHAAASGLHHLHSRAGKHQTIIHRDIKSANILLDENWVAKISDLGLSRLNLAGFGRSAVISNACGTPGYCEPEYIITGIVTKKSDVYSFGMVLFEVLCGRLCNFKEQDGFKLSAEVAREQYKKRKLHEILDPSVREQMIPYSMEKFSAIAYECLQSRDRRPHMNIVMKELEETIIIQEEYEFEKERELKLRAVSESEFESESDEYSEAKLPRDFEFIIKKFKIPHSIYSNNKTLLSFLRKGILFDGDNRFFRINKDRKKCESISAIRFLDMDGHSFLKLKSHSDSRFPLVVEYSSSTPDNINCQIKTSMLSFGTMYAAILVFKYPKKSLEDLSRLRLITIRWKTKEMRVCSTHTAELTSDNWYKIKMWHFINNGPNAEFEFTLEELSYQENPNASPYGLLIQGIEFQPIEMSEEIEGFKSLSIRDEEGLYFDADADVKDEYWEEKLPDDYSRYIEISDKPLDYTTKKELYLRLYEGFLGLDGQLWFSICKSTRGIISMLPASYILGAYPYFKRAYTMSLPGSRFGVVKCLREGSSFKFKCKLRSPMFSPHFNYACYLVFKIGGNHSTEDEFVLFTAECKLDGISQVTAFGYLNLPSMNIPTIKPNNDYESQNSSNIRRVEGLRMPKDQMEHLGYKRIEKRKDGWMEVMLCNASKLLEDRTVLEVNFVENMRMILSDMTVEGVEFRPCI